MDIVETPNCSEGLSRIKFKIAYPEKKNINIQDVNTRGGNPYSKQFPALELTDFILDYYFKHIAENTYTDCDKKKMIRRQIAAKCLP